MQLCRQDTFASAADTSDYWQSEIFAFLLLPFALVVATCYHCFHRGRARCKQNSVRDFAMEIVWQPAMALQTEAVSLCPETLNWVLVKGFILSCHSRDL